VFAARFLAQLNSLIEPSVFILGDETALRHARFADGVINVRRLDWEPAADDPDFLDVVCRTFRHADRVLLTFSDQRERAAWASFMRLTGINTELLEPELGPLAPSGIGEWADAPTLVVARGPLSLAERVTKRVFDLAVVLLLAPAALPVVAVLAALV